jgi:hypothetical protein
MRMPNAENALVECQKVRDYLLSLTHPVGRHKAVFFHAFGYTVDNWTTLETALRQHALNGEVLSVEVRFYGRYYEIVGELPSPDGRSPQLKSVWEVMGVNSAPRFITAYPAKEGS